MIGRLLLALANHSKGGGTCQKKGWENSTTWTGLDHVVIRVGLTVKPPFSCHSHFRMPLPGKILTFKIYPRILGSSVYIFSVICFISVDLSTCRSIPCRWSNLQILPHEIWYDLMAVRFEATIVCFHYFMSGYWFTTKNNNHHRERTVSLSRKTTRLQSSWNKEEN